MESRKSLEAIVTTDQALADQIAIGQHMENRNRFPTEELETYRGQWIAWSLDGTRIIAHADDPDTLDALILEAGEILSGALWGACRKRTRYSRGQLSYSSRGQTGG